MNSLKHTKGREEISVRRSDMRFLGFVTPSPMICRTP
jgi:hypothetical protein